MEHFASGFKRNYYGKGDVIVYRLNRDGTTPAGQSPVFGADVLMLTYGDAFWPTYTTGDNTGLVATDSMKNFIQRETLNFAGDDLADYCRFLGHAFLDKYPQGEGVQVSASEIVYQGLDGQVALFPGGPDRAFARVELTRAAGREPRDAIADATCGILGFNLLRLGGSAFVGFVRDEYTTLPEVTDRPLYIRLDLEWRYLDPANAFATTDVARIRAIVHDVFRTVESGSIQNVIYKMGVKILDDVPAIGEVHLEANNRTWETVGERDESLGVYTEARRPYGCLGLRLTRSTSSDSRSSGTLKPR
jgi:urate oxidase / 2-oxo-4-hydroxy-4-carboxy-5-ureidoimidazoline decarboxylase